MKTRTIMTTTTQRRPERSEKKKPVMQENLKPKNAKAFWPPLKEKCRSKKTVNVDQDAPKNSVNRRSIKHVKLGSNAPKGISAKAIQIKCPS